jgi:hypothetical protein
MNERIKELGAEAWSYSINYIGDEVKPQIMRFQEKFAELIVKECARQARDTDLEDVEGGDSAVLRAAKAQILEHFGVTE